MIKGAGSSRGRLVPDAIATGLTSNQLVTVFTRLGHIFCRFLANEHRLRSALSLAKVYQTTGRELAVDGLLVPALTDFT